jgi:hypothetical protein
VTMAQIKAVYILTEENEKQLLTSWTLNAEQVP